MATWRKGYRNKTRKVRLEISATGQHEFIGGNLGHGECKNAVGKGNATVGIKLKAPAGYRIRSMSDQRRGVTLTGTGKNQMSASVKSGGQRAEIKNTCAAAADVNYTVNVRTASGGNIACHPKIVNT
jgi:hypothetical protein